MNKVIQIPEKALLFRSQDRRKEHGNGIQRYGRIEQKQQSGD